MIYPKYEVYRENVEIPHEVLINQNLNFIQKYIYSIILEDCNTLGYCNATNEYFQKLLQVAERSVRKSINKLIELGLIVVHYKIKANFHNKRVIFLNKDFNSNEYIEIYKKESIKISLQNNLFKNASLKNALWNLILEEHKNKGYVYLTNTYFMEVLNIGKHTVKEILRDFKRRGLIKIELENNNKRKIIVIEQ